jgi:beta-carotene hydroxylase
MTDLAEQRRVDLRAERAIVAPFRAAFETRVIATFAVFAAGWTAVLILGATGTIPLWMGLIVNTVLATTFYMPLHEAAHGNIWGDGRTSRRGEELIGVLASIPVGFSFAAHRSSHMRHHAFTNDPDRDPDHYTDGPLTALPYKWLAVIVLQSMLPLFAFVPSTRRFLPAQVRRSFREPDDGDQTEGLQQLRYWLIAHALLLGAFVLGFGWPALLLWYIPARLQALWLLFVFAWYPHHPAATTGRYVDTRVAVFPGSTLLIRGHDHHALHHLFPRVPHYRLPHLWQEIGPQLTAKGVRTEGRALGATSPIVW